MNLPEIRGEYSFDVDLSKFSLFGVGGKADVVFYPKDKEDLSNFLKNKDKNIQIFTIGVGSNLLIRDGGIRGVVIVLKKYMNSINLNSDDTITVEAGVLDSKLFSFCKENGIAGYEFIGTIPGTVGGAIKMNAGCYGSSTSDFIIKITAIDFDGNIKEFKKEECGFEYRKNGLPEDLIFIGAIFDAKNKASTEEIDNKFREYTKKRLDTQPHGVKTCGSTFKNPPDYPAWKVIQEISMQNVEMNGAKMSEKHANFMINTGTAKASDLENLGNLIVKKAKEEKGIDLEWEVKRVGDF